MKRIPVDEVIHPCLASAPGAAGSLVREGGGDPHRTIGTLQGHSDRERLGLVLQGAALLASLERGGWRLERGFEAARVTTEGRLVVNEAGPGSDPVLVQDRLTRLLQLAFGLAPGGAALAGRGEARRAARRLLGSWRQQVTPLDPDRAVVEILAEAPYLWEPRYVIAIQALGCELRCRGVARRWVVGPAEKRERFLAASSDYRGLNDLLNSPAAQKLWQGEAGADPIVLAERGRWRLAVEAFERFPPRDAGARLIEARCHFADGRFERALELLRGRRGLAERILRVQCQYQLGELRAARRALAKLELEQLEGAATVELGSVALRVYANSGDKREVRLWIDRLERVGRSRAPARLCARALIEAAQGYWDLNDDPSARCRLDEVASMLPDDELDDRYWQARALLARTEGDAAEAVRCVERAIGRTRHRRLRRFEAGRLWNDLLFARTAMADLAGAERAGHHAYAHLSRCDGPSASTLALANLAEVRLRRGRLDGVREIVERSLEANRLAGNVRGGSQDAGLWARYWLAHGEPERALEACRSILDSVHSPEDIWHHFEIAALAVRALGWLGRAPEAADLLERLPEEALGVFEPEERPALVALAGKPDEARAVAEALGEGRAGEVWRHALPANASALGVALDGLRHEIESYRYGRCLLDLRLTGVSIPHGDLRLGARALEDAGAASLAERLRPTANVAWRTVRDFLEADPVDAEAVGRLLREGGHPSARLLWRGADEERVLVDGPGGSVRVSQPGHSGSFELEGVREVPWSTLLRLVVQCLPGIASFEDGEGSRERRSPSAAADVGTRRARRSARRHGIMGSSEAIKRTLDRLQRLASREVPVLLQGETGTGKELAARLLHEESPRARGPFEPVNCAAMAQENLLLSQLFGHAKGAFTGAERDEKGIFEAARGGTVFLDEIGDLPSAAQGLLLRLLEAREVRRLGETRVRKVDIRVIAATHRKLAELVERGTFREDLYYRLAVATVTLPPLREREGDVKELAEHFAARLPGSPQLASETLERLGTHRWPGNVRQLLHVIETAAVLASTEEGASATPRIEPRHLDLASAEESSPRGTYHEQVDAFRRGVLERALTRHDGNQAAAARELGITRQALSQAVRKLGLQGS